ncbi:MAG: alpha/beta hydrolase [Prevotellaceae bacterium]|jgi:acetyl esterase/lipase|nr:alpha/beta hydrolase [Prevotellaceae bacterium]
MRQPRLLLLLLHLVCIPLLTLSAQQLTLTPYLPDRQQAAASDSIGTAGAGIAVIICPGGSYYWLNMKEEGADVARLLQRRGIAAFVLKYRTAGVPAFLTRYRLLWKGNQHPAMIQDLQRAIEWVRTHAADYHIRTDRIGVMGFSAGGHLALMSGELFDTDFTQPAGNMPPHTASLRPDFVAAIYPVVTLADGRYVHRRSRRGLLGERRKNDPAMRDSLSMERHVRPDMPPVFLMNCADDPVVKPRNAELLDSVLTARSVPHTYLRYATGGHGFGARPRPSAAAAGWMDDFFRWLSDTFNLQ